MLKILFMESVTQVSLNHGRAPVTSPEVDIWDEFDRIHRTSF